MRLLFIMLCLVSALSCFSQGMHNALTGKKEVPFTQKPMGTFVRPTIPINSSISLIPPNFYTSDLGFFCRQELKMQQVHIPLVFRIGSMDYCNYLEQKPGYKNTEGK